MTEKQRQAIEKHGRNLQAIFPATANLDPMALCRRVRRIEREGAALALSMCSPDGPDDSEREKDRILAKLDRLLSFSEAGVPVFLNTDPRGYALKIDDKWLREHGNALDHPSNAPTAVCRLHRDWGGYGIIAPEIGPEGD